MLAERRSSQMQLILESLYNVKTDFFESDFSRLYSNIKKHITHRSLILMYTNFETMDGLERQLPYLKAISKNHSKNKQKDIKKYLFNPSYLPSLPPVAAAAAAWRWAAAAARC